MAKTPEIAVKESLWCICCMKMTPQDQAYEWRAKDHENVYVCEKCHKRLKPLYTADVFVKVKP